MTIVSHQHKFIFLKPRKTAGTSMESALLRIIGHDDWVATSTENEPLESRFLATANKTDPCIPAQRAFKRLLRRVGPKALRLREHMPAQAVLSLVGPEIWSSYRKVSVVRDPWRRLISLWRWRSRRDGLEVDFDGFLNAIESGSRTAQKAVGARRWSNLPFYAINGDLVLDRVLRFESLANDFWLMAKDLDLPDPGPLPYLKVMNKPREDPLNHLTDSQIKRISVLCSTEIKWFGYQFPNNSLRP